jgi:ParB family transcriptional regulator, chromosome partitioning protein
LELAGAVTQATLNDWRPDDTFLDLLSGKDVVNAMLTDIGSPAVAEANKDATTKLQKGIIKDYLTGENGGEHKPDWLPAYFRFPIAAHTDRAGIAIVDKWQSFAELLSLAT